MADLSTETDGGYRRGSSRRSGSGKSGQPFLLNSFVVVLLLGGLGAGIWFAFTQQQTLSAETSRLDDVGSRISALEARLSATDNAMVQEGQDTKQQIGFWQDEIRKLWAISNERNRKWIKDNERNVERITQTMDGLISSNRDVQAAVDRHESAFDQQQGIIDQLTSLELQLQQVVRSQRDLVDKGNKVNLAFSKIKGDLSGKVNDNVEAIESIDAYRLVINARLREIKQVLDGLVGQE